MMAMAMMVFLIDINLTIYSYCILVALVEGSITAANSTIQLSVQQWYEAYNYYPALVQAESKLSLASLLYGERPFIVGGKNIFGTQMTSISGFFIIYSFHFSLVFIYSFGGSYIWGCEGCGVVIIPMKAPSYTTYAYIYIYTYKISYWLILQPLAPLQP